MTFNFASELIHDQLLSMRRSHTCRYCVYRNSRYTWLTLDNVVHSVMDNSNHHKLLLPHLHTIGLLAAPEYEPKRLLELGLGGGSFFRFCKHYFPNSEFTCVEHDPLVVDLFNQFFNPDELPISIRLEDALQFVKNASSGYYDWILVDLYGIDHGPSFLMDESFYQMLNRILSQNGKILINFLGKDNKEKEQLLRPVCSEFSNRLTVVAVPKFLNMMAIISTDNIESPDLKLFESLCLDPESFVLL